jgi:predicted N-acyltransferase
MLLKAVIAWCEKENLSSLHLLFCSDEDVQACKAESLMLRHTVQFHWTNTQTPYADFDAFLTTMAQDKRKKIRAERRKVADAGVTFRWSLGSDISNADWDFFYRCYERTYWEHGNAPYLSREFFKQMQTTMPENWLLFTAERDGKPIATSLVAVNAINTSDIGKNGTNNDSKIAYGRYWGALERVDCLHFEACYYQPIEWCINHGYQRFEGGAQGEHKMARALLPIKATSAHWLAHPAFAEAVQRFLDREGQGIENYMEDLGRRSPLKG